ncbi:MAG TPA: FadR/GntR family transcriptional regulator [Hyphomicrobiaceae bacterium]|nr:FadR/GntR family transcriptional regulator [Hyphomicrobiaceae bacterium]
MPIQSIEPRRLYRQVAEQLRALIDRGEYPVGSRLPTERELAAQLGVSRPTVREALIALEVDGRVRIRVGSGIYVTAPPAPSPALPDATQPIAGPFELLEARALFEGAVAERVAELVTPDDLAVIDAALERMWAVTVSGPDSIEADRTFHLAIAGVLGNDAVTKVVGDLFDQRINPYFARLASYFETSVSWRMACEEHQTIRNRIAARDPAGARAAMETHLERSRERFTRTFGAPSPDDASRPEAQAATSPPTQAPTLHPVVTTRRKSR